MTGNTPEPDDPHDLMKALRAALIAAQLMYVIMNTAQVIATLTTS